MSSLSVVSLLTGFLTAMVVITEISDDGSNGGDPPKKPQEEPKENRSFVLTIPDDVIETCVAMVPRCHYPTLTSVCRYFRTLTASSIPYVVRSLRNITESVLYAFIGFDLVEIPRWYILHRIPHRNQVISLRLCKIDSLPPSMPFGSAVVTIGHEMYVIGGCDRKREQILSVFLIDCRHHTLRELRSMNRARCRAAAGVIDGKIYVIGGCEKSYPDWVEVYDLKTEAWSPVPGPYPCGTQKGEIKSYVVMKEKIYLLDRNSCFSYEPRTGNWESYDRLRLFWLTSSCVVDDRLYTLASLGLPGRSSVIVYDPAEKNWVLVEGVHGLPKLFYHDYTMANFGGKLVILGITERYTDGPRDILCLEIGLERRQGGEIWGNVESVKCVLTSLTFVVLLRFNALCGMVSCRYVSVCVDDELYDV